VSRIGMHVHGLQICLREPGAVGCDPVGFEHRAVAHLAVEQLYRLHRQVEPLLLTLVGERPACVGPSLQGEHRGEADRPSQHGRRGAGHPGRVIRLDGLPERVVADESHAVVGAAPACVPGR